MAELNDDLDWELGMCLSEVLITQAIQNKNYGIHTHRYNCTDSSKYLIFFNLKPPNNALKRKLMSNEQDENSAKKKNQKIGKWKNKNK